MSVFCFTLALISPLFLGGIASKIGFFSGVASHIAHDDFSFCVARSKSE